MSDITSLTLTQTLKALEEKQFSEEDLNRAYLERIKKYNLELNAYLLVNEKSSKIPAAIKDVISTKGILTTASSKVLENYIPPYNATVIDKLLEQGISIIGKTNHDEFAMGGSGENSAFRATKNPWDITKIPGGSSAGSAAAVAADLCVFALGSDTGGSIRQPSSLCGVVGLKTSYGRVSRYGLIAMASSLDSIGPITKSVEDATLVLDWISGADGKDSNSSGAKFTMHHPSRLQAGIKGLRVGVPKEYFGEGLDLKVKKVIEDAIKKLEELGAEIIEVSLPHSEYALAAYYIIVPSEVSSNMARFDGIRFGKGHRFLGEVIRRIILGVSSLSSQNWEYFYAKAAKVRTLVKGDFEKAFEKVDVIVGPVSPTTAWNIGEKIDDPLKMYLSDIYTITANLAGIPGLSVPCGFVDGLPVGLQIMGKQWDEETILRAGYAYEQATNWHKEKPKL